MLIDGKKIAEDIKNSIHISVQKMKMPPKMAIVVAGKNPVIEKFVAIKKKFGDDVGISVTEFRFLETCSQSELEGCVRNLAANNEYTGIVIQLPLPEGIDARSVLDLVPREKDSDMLSTNSMAAMRRGDAVILAPVVGAIAEICERENITIAGKDVLILGAGRLVGAPAEIWFRHRGAHVTTLEKPVRDLAMFTKDADIIVSGTGKPGILTPELLKEGVILFDAGTSEDGGKVRGDADPECAKHCSIFTPVPGGIGPITVAVLFKNLITLAHKK
ncbi:MAG: hypothetical protein COZ49_03115 [Candidatus Yonathbacteria bacterium CG_4_10_14_3_um_filter_47_65]|uniref:Uncharacterized protein n=2 Tax=Parcubacteria group TaxID=1794811 RepID=A0A2M8D5E1_9BACT|nr:MAG: hypothetical protein AUJ44_02550 [Candidatus Nomurabacteria bacterium CG1_02_47_685]PIP03322.1 MAG: hypothetical protein COX54_04040 [Candidatus Yonathbacteria bacterium CG23_combo_of_CG06-09_8_20_14_all_46_18]PIQ31431.1 MAG: hypothetical protein COW61_03645 [Candidatus Yonathbacteria bacterium CG17_big_fil_post_rev_8_21_14_2_50_46_19]PIX56240.1 MAG: hypothetical protein COZ49_03115 [Candidatus Yonathbacteria bacterium CG_4_10_14_3_um_filter_47_65]PIY58007.1 MAG: hypothetical protein CO